MTTVNQITLAQFVNLVFLRALSGMFLKTLMMAGDTFFQPILIYSSPTMQATLSSTIPALVIHFPIGIGETLESLGVLMGQQVTILHSASNL